MDVRLVKPNSVRQDLQRRNRDIVDAWHAELSTDLICACCVIVPTQSNVGEIPPLLSGILDKRCGICIRLRYGKIENRGSRGDVDRDGNVSTMLSRCRADEQGDYRNRKGEHVD